MSAPSPKALRKAAVALAASGVPVFPVYPSGKKAKRPLTKNGFKDATLDTDLIEMWWKRPYKGAGIAFPTGHMWDVLDVDTKNEADGRIHLPYLNRVGLLDGCKRIVKTPSGGWHLYFKATPGVTNRASAELGLDVRGRGGYVLAPPSFVDTEDYSGAYEDHGPTSGSTDDPLLWEMIQNALCPTNKETNKPIPLLAMERRASIAHLRGWLIERQTGERNNSLHWAVWRCIDSGIDPHELLDTALEIGLDEDEVRLTMGSALKRAGVKASDLQSEAEALFS